MNERDSLLFANDDLLEIMGSRTPVLPTLAHLIAKSSRQFMEAIYAATGSTAAPWPALPHALPDLACYGDCLVAQFTAWTNAIAQHEFLTEWCDGRKMYGNNAIIVPIEYIEAATSSLLSKWIASRRSKYEGVKELLDAVPWLVMDFGGDADYLILVCRDRRTIDEIVMTFCKSNQCWALEQRSDGIWSLPIPDCGGT